MATAITQQQKARMLEIIDKNDNLEGLVLGSGSLTPKFIIVAEAPGRKEAETGVGFVGPSGQELQTWLDYLNVTRDEIYITAAVRSRPFSEKNGNKKDRPPNKTEIKEFAGFLDHELQELNSHTIIALGNTALQRLLGPEYKVTQVHGQIIEHEILEFNQQTNQFEYGSEKWTVIPLFHPSYVRRFAQKNRPIVMDDLKRIKKVVGESK